MERIVSKIPLKKINPRELLQLSRALKQSEIIKNECTESSNEYLRRLGDGLNPCRYISEKIAAVIIENPPALASKGSFINKGFHTGLDELRSIAHHGKEYLLQLQQKESETTGISSLKIGYNNVFGYYLEVTNSHKSKVPPQWMRKQTLANAERFITPELKEYEEKITGAEEKILAIELQLFDSLLNELLDFIAPIQADAHSAAIIDCLCCFAANALQHNYKKPVLHDGDEIEIKGGRHPVIERSLPPSEQYISNNLLLNKDEQQIIILTGPNMSGKSALLRQTALITLMAHTGSFVPATEARISLTDKIFTRVGASDNLSAGESTFMVEMNESASIINNVSPRCLILLDEIGRGTSTYDGISIAWSMVEHLHNAPQQPKTFFATHYHELNELENKLPRVKNFHVTNKEAGNKIIFLRKLAPGGSTHSFGIHVAKMAGMPASLVQRANEVLKQLESKGVETNMTENIKALSMPKVQLSIFDAHSQTFNDIRNMLENFDINRLTPVEALLKLNEIKNLLK
jgi:DNA mismatch repair protein MutS